MWNVMRETWLLTRHPHCPPVWFTKLSRASSTCSNECRTQAHTQLNLQVLKFCSNRTGSTWACTHSLLGANPGLSSGGLGCSLSPLIFFEMYSQINQSEASPLLWQACHAGEANTSPWLCLTKKESHSFDNCPKINPKDKWLAWMKPVTKGKMQSH